MDANFKMTSKWLSDLSDVKTLKVCEKIISVDGGEKKNLLRKTQSVCSSQPGLHLALSKDIWSLKWFSVHLS